MSVFHVTAAVSDRNVEVVGPGADGQRRSLLVVNRGLGTLRVVAGYADGTHVAYTLLADESVSVELVDGEALYARCDTGSADMRVLGVVLAGRRYSATAYSRVEYGGVVLGDWPWTPANRVEADAAEAARELYPLLSVEEF